jgi:hypothetical protein
MKRSSFPHHHQPNYCRYFIVALLLCLVFLWVSLFLKTNQSDATFFGFSSQRISLPSYQLTKKEYYEQLPGHSLGSYLPSKQEFQLLLSNPERSTIGGTYPHFFKLGELLKQWPSNNTKIHSWKRSPAHPSRGKGLFRFNFMNETERKLAAAVKEKDLPFILYNIPEIDTAARDIFTYEGLKKLFGNTPRIIEQAPSNEFIYYTSKNLDLVHHRFPEWKPPQEDILMTFPQFAKEAEEAEKDQRDDITGKRSLYYMIINAGEDILSRRIFEVTSRKERIIRIKYSAGRSIFTRNLPNFMFLLILLWVLLILEFYAYNIILNH